MNKKLVSLLLSLLLVIGLIPAAAAADLSLGSPIGLLCDGRRAR